MKILTLAALALVLAPAARAEDLSGTVAETMDSGGYTYMLIQTPAGQKKWAAVTQTAVKKGQSVTVSGAMDMKDFESPTLKRKFDHIAFGMMGGGAAAPAGDPHAGLPKGHGAMGGAPAANPSPMSHGGRAEVKGPIKVAKAAGADARTVGELYAQKKALKGQTVTVAGKVVKYTPDILDRNWAHIRDGSGSAKDGSDDVTVLLKDQAEMGQVITVRGKVVLDKDLGGMYKFPVAIEDAVLVK
ncbi:MAG: nucleotide-binding protein [Elusimicrobia bacterium]|nr:nucleotide-binding protein [Elusimicrobiota bacterium]